MLGDNEDFYDEREQMLSKKPVENEQKQHNFILDLNKETAGKIMGGVIQDFMPALKEIAELGSSNNKPFGKYDRGSWLKVNNPEQAYLDAFWRHQLEGMYNTDPTTGRIHLVAMAWNLLALLVFYLRSQQTIVESKAPDQKRTCPYCNLNPCMREIHG